MHYHLQKCDLNIWDGKAQETFGQAKPQLSIWRDTLVNAETLGIGECRSNDLRTFIIISIKDILLLL